MSYETFNEAMCKLRQAEEEFNRKLQEAFKPFIDEINKVNKVNREADLQAQIDAAYNKGLKDMHEAIRLIATDESDGGMSVFELKDAFGTLSVFDIILGFTPEEIIDKTLAWITKRKESQELHVGDEIEYTYPGREPEKCIVINLENGIENEKIIWTIGLDLSQLSWFSSNCYWGDTYYKTGKHYDSIPLKKEEHE